MTKILMTLAFLTSFLTQSAHADFETSITPQLPVNCAVESSNHVSWIYLLNKVEENDSTVSFSFVYSQGACRESKVTIAETMSSDMRIGFVHYGLIFPWNNNAIDVKTTNFAGNDQVSVLLTFDKKKLFSRKNSHKFQMTIQPSKYSSLSFQWNLAISKKSDNSSALMFVNN